MVNLQSFRAQTPSDREGELMEEEDGVVWGCFYMQRLKEAGIAREATSIDRPSMEAVTVAVPPPLMDSPRWVP